MTIVPFTLQVAALVCLIFAAFGFFSSAKVAWGWAGLALWILSLMFMAIQLHPIYR